MKNFKFPKSKKVQTLIRFNRLKDSEFLKTINFEDLSLEELKSLSSNNLRYMYRKQIDRFQKYYLKTKKISKGEKITYIFECEMKQLVKELKRFRNRCDQADLSLIDFDFECVKFITNKDVRFIFKSRIAQCLYQTKNTLGATFLSGWGYRKVTKLASIDPSLMKSELFSSFLPICFFTGVTLKFWSYISKPIPSVSKTFDAMSSVALSPIWLLEIGLNKLTGTLYTKYKKTPIPLNVIGEINSGTGLTWKQFRHTYLFVKKMTDNWTYESFIDD